ncbi:class I SAM-dependent methyltransferase [Paenibacillus sp. NPDC057967]|uniref:class I SAM-dependent methyltransferase n=1 Tax=Paenibacillus sp. NPDC057967 TaxID=3346293 RepID=UPI0036DE9538
MMIEKLDRTSYEGIVADTYDIWFPGESFEDTAFYEACMREAPGLALEIGCGTGRLLLPYLKKGYEIHGMEPSPRMREHCLAKGEKLGLSPVLHDQFMERMDLADVYRTIFIPLASFMLVTARQEAKRALKLMHVHLETGGQLIIPLFIPREQLSVSKKEWSVRRVGEREDGAAILLNQASEIQFNEQVQVQWNRYEVYENSALAETYFSETRLRWYYRHEFQAMLEDAGFKDIAVYGGYDRRPLGHDGTFMIFRAWK